MVRMVKDGEDRNRLQITFLKTLGYGMVWYGGEVSCLQRTATAEAVVEFISVQFKSKNLAHKPLHMPLKNYDMN